MRFISIRPRLAAAALTAILTGLAVTVQAPPASASRALRTPPPTPTLPLDEARGERRAPTPPAHALRSRRARHVAAAAPTYTILDVGSPASEAFSPPYAFNDAGQIVGQSYTPSTGTFDCYAYTGPETKRFVDLSAGSTLTACEPTALSALDGRAATFVGYGYETTLGYFAVSGRFTTAGSSTVQAMTNVVTSYLIGVNASGEAVGAGVYLPAGGFVSDDPPYIVPPGTSALTVAQPQCTISRAGCAEPEYEDAACPFGGCEINDSGLLLGFDAGTGRDMAYRYGGSSVDLPFEGETVALNDAAQILYNTSSCVTCTGSALLYSMRTGTTTPIPLPAKSTCTSTYGLSLNNVGEVLGVTANCPGGDDVYWTWTAKAGLRVLDDEIPSNSYAGIYPRGVNDEGQILVGLETANAEHWGMLVPK